MRSPSTMAGHILAGLILAASTALAQDQRAFPINLEIDVVFPRNDTYAIVSPFPVVFGLQNSHGALSYPTTLHWTVDCGHGTMGGSNYLYGVRNSVPAADPFFFVNVSRPIAQLSSRPSADPFPYWKGFDADVCRLEWDFNFSTNCTRDATGITIGGGTYGKRKGSVTFTLKAGGKIPADEIALYGTDATMCPIFGVSTQVEKNETGCAHIGDTIPAAQPCSLSVKPAVSSILALLPTPTVTFTPTGTSGGSSTTSTGGSGSGSGSGSSSGNGNGGSAAPPQLLGGVGIAVLLAGGAAAGAMLL